METEETTLDLKLKQLPHEPGVYRLLGKGSRILYVGKAQDLASREGSYFQKSADHPLRLRSLGRRVVDVEVTITANPVEALLLESSLIKLHKPRYNVNLKDDKRYPYIRLTLEDEFPRAIFTRDTTEKRSAYFGPFTSAKAVRRTIRTLQQLFQLRVCKREVHVWEEQGGTEPTPDWQPCLRNHLDHCCAPCVGKVSRATYGSYVKAAKDFLLGRRGDATDKLQRSMREAAQRREYESAARYRDMLRSIDALVTQQHVISEGREDLDVLGLARRRGETVIELLKIREGYLLADEHFRLEAAPEETDGIILFAFINGYYTGADWIPRRILLPSEPEDKENLELLLTALRSRGGVTESTKSRLRFSPSDSGERKRNPAKVHLDIPQRGSKRRLLEMAERNARKSLEDELIAALAKRGQAEASIELAKRLGLEDVPTLIEGMDISNLGAEHPVASLVSFRNGRPHKAGYRHYKLKTPGPDDFAMLAELVHRRYPKLAAQGRLPDLVIVDGGKGQLGAVVKALEEDDLGGAFPVVGIAKKEELLYLPGRSTPIRLGEDSSALHLVQRVRDEAHRFGLRFHRQLRRSDGLQSVLERIPGIGPKKRRALLDAFGSLKKIRKASVEELTEVKGITLKLATDLQNYLKIHYF